MLNPGWNGKKMALKLEKTVSELESIVENTTFGIVYEQDGVIVRVNKAFEKILGYDRSEVIGRKSALLRLARWKMKNNPGKYVDHIYGEHEVGGTSWLYLSAEPFETVGFPRLGTKAPPRLTESIQHGLFQYFAAPIILFAVLGGIMGVTGYLKSAKEDFKGSTGAKGDRP